MPPRVPRRITRRLLAAGLAAVAVLLACAVSATAAPVLTIESPAPGHTSNETQPTFSGTTSDWLDGLTLKISEGGSPVQSVPALPELLTGAWSATPAPLSQGSYTAVAEQTELLSGESGASAPLPFRVITSPPTVTLEAVPSPSNDTTPSFSGTASEEGPVTVQISPVGHPKDVVAQAHGSVSGVAWTSGEAGPGLADGTYTAVAIQQSAYGNGPGSSEERTFTVDTQPPEVTLNPIAARSNDTTPSFSGFASDTSQVKVLVSREGTVVAEATAAGDGGEWSTAPLAAELPDGRYTAVAEQQSTIGNGTGKSSKIEFEVLTAPPAVTLNAPPSPSGNTSPSFTGTAADTTTVTVHIYRGAVAEGTPVASAVAKGTGAGFASGAASPALESGEYAAVAGQPSSLGNPEGHSSVVRFVIDTSSPHVTLKPITTPSNHTTPTFSGTASDSPPVVVHVFNNAAQEVATASGTPSGGSWTSGSLSKALTSGSYTAVATEASSLGNPPGESAPIGFVVDTRSPTVTLEQPPALSRDTTPTFSGTAGDSGPVKVFVFAGKGTSGKLEREAEGAVSAGEWSAGPVAALPDGTYTVIAEQQSSLGNPPGFSAERTFAINTKAPEVTLEAPSARTGSTSPTFSGTASDTTPVTVYVFAGTTTSGTPVATAGATLGAGAWTSGSLSKLLTEGVYTVLAKQESSISGNPTGVSNAATFTLETRSPTVTLKAPESPSAETAPTFKGTASDTTAVKVHIYAGETAKGTPIATALAAAPGAEGAWSSAAATPPLPPGEGTYTAVAEQESFVGNPAGVSKPVTFRVDTLPPKLTLAAPASPSNNLAPAFSGTTDVFRNTDGRIPPVVVHVLLGGSEVARAELTPAGEGWTTPAVAPALPAGEHTFTAYATEASPLGNAEARTAEVPFLVDTEPPSLQIEPIATPSANLRPVFSGRASDSGPVSVKVYRGTTPTGKPVSEALADVIGGAWSTGPMPELPSEAGKFVAVARQKSSLGNEEGKAQLVFTIAPAAPLVHLDKPAEYLGTATPRFSGSSNEGGHPVVVNICTAPGPCGAGGGGWKAEGPGGSRWTTGPATPALPDGRYQAIATQRGATGELGATEAETFTVDTVPPAPALSSPSTGSTLPGPNAVVTGSRGTSPGDERSVTVQLFAGPAIAAGQPPLQEVSVGASSSSWSATLGGLSPGVYTVRAEQSDLAGNVGFSSPATFAVSAPGAGSGPGPSASFTWYPAAPHPGEQVTLASTSTDAGSPLTGYAWSVLGSPFAAGAQSRTVTFAGIGGHSVSLRVLDAAGRSSVATQTIPVSYPLLKPFPVVRIVTTRAIGRTRLKVLSVQAPAGATIQISCTGKSCPLRSLTRLVPRPKARTAATAVSFAAFQRSLGPGTTLQIRVYEDGRVGKFTSFAIRRGKLPVRRDGCLEASNPKPIECPA